MKPERIPPSIHLLDSMRSVGYSLDAALADLIDNSITAGARSVRIDADVVEGHYLAVLDNGRGMSPKVAREALRFAGGSKDREASDLGRFGLGLKTASLSQARILTLVTIRAGVTTALRWDIDYVRRSGEWMLMVLDPTEISELPLWPSLQSQEAGTLVVWQELDLLLGDSAAPGAYLAERLGSVRSSLGLVFHRYLADSRDKLLIAVNGISLRPLDPFLADSPKTQRSSPETLLIGGAAVTVEAFTLPHSSDLTHAQRMRPDLGDGMREAQGFYVYRNRRLISHGHWYGLARMNEISKQTRVQVDVPTSLDALWQLDIKKSRAEPPQSFKVRLRQLMDPILDRGRRVHSFRGRRENVDVAHTWSKVRGRQGLGYEVNLESPLVAATLSRLSTDDAERVVGLLQTLSTTFPLLDAYLELASNAQVAAPRVDSEMLLPRLYDLRTSGLLDDDVEVAVTQIESVEPFNQVEDLVSLVRKVWEEVDVAR